MIRETKTYVQGGVIADRTTVCDLCGKDIPTGTVGWAYIQETKTQAQARLMREQGGNDEFQHVCISCWKKAKEEYLRPVKEGKDPIFRKREPRDNNNR